MKKLLLIILLLTTVQTFGQRKVMFADWNGDYTANSHDSRVLLAFITGYESSGLTWDSLREGHTTNTATSFDTIFANENYKIWVRSTSNQPSYNQYANKFYSYPLFFMPSNQTYSDSCSCFPSVQTYFDSLPRMVLTGAGVNSNMTAYRVEFYAPDITGCGNCPSFSNSYIAGQIMAIMDARDCDTWEARYCARITATNGLNPTIKCGFGRINIDSAIAYSGTIIPDPYLPLYPLEDDYQIVSYTDQTKFLAINGEVVMNGLGYYIYKNDSLVMVYPFFRSDTKYTTDERSFNSFIKFHYRIINRDGKSALMSPTYIRFHKYKNIIVR